MASKKSIKKNSLIYMIRTLMNVIFPLITFKYASGIIMAEGIGAAHFSSAVIGYVGLLSSLGISTYAIATGSKIRKDRVALSKFIGEILTINICSMVFAYCVLAILLVSITRFEPYRLLILIYSSTILFSTVGIEWFFTIEEDFSYITVRSIILQIVSIILLFILVKNENDVPWYVALTAISSAGGGTLNFIHSRRKIKYSLSPLRECKKHLKPILIIWAANIASLIYVNADTIIIGLINGDTANGYYSAAVKIIKAVCMPIASISVVAGPQLCEAIAEKNQIKVDKIAKQVIDFMSFFIFPCILGLFLLGAESIVLISGEEFLPGLTAERILLIDIILSPINGFIVNQVMIPIKKEKKTMVVMIIAASANILLDCVLIEKIGIDGAAIATVFSESLVFILCAPNIKRVISIRNAGRDVWKYALSSLVIIPLNYLLKSFINNSVVNVVLLVVLSVICYSLLIGVLTKSNPIKLLVNRGKQ